MNRHLDKMHKFLEKYKFTKTKEKKKKLHYSITVTKFGSILYNLPSGNRYSPVYVLIAQSCLTLRDPMDCSPPGSSVHDILQARILEWVAIPCSRG